MHSNPDLRDVALVRLVRPGAATERPKYVLALRTNNGAFVDLLRATHENERDVLHRRGREIAELLGIPFSEAVR